MATHSLILSQCQHHTYPSETNNKPDKKGMLTFPSRNANIPLHIPGDQEGRCEVEISIFGDNLYPPVLGEEEYTTSVNENTSPPKVLFTVTATDQDTMYFGEVCTV